MTREEAEQYLYYAMTIGEQLLSDTGNCIYQFIA